MSTADHRRSLLETELTASQLNPNTTDNSSGHSHRSTQIAHVHIPLQDSAGDDEVEDPYLPFWELFILFVHFGLNAWGGPMAQINMLREELVEKRKWLTNGKFLRVYSVYQALPGPEAMELCCYFGYVSRGRIGSLVAGAGFILPGFTLMLLASWWYTTTKYDTAYGLSAPFVSSGFQALQPAIAAMVVRATHRIGESAIMESQTVEKHPDRVVSIRYFMLGLFFLSAFHAILGINFIGIFLVTGLLFEFFVTQKTCLCISTVIVDLVLLGYVASGNANLDFLTTNGVGVAPTPDTWRLFLLGLLAGLLSFGGAYTAIPYVQQEAVVLGGWLSLQTFLDGIAIGTVIPAPLVIFSTFVGFVGNSWGGAVVMTIGMFFPAFAFTFIGHRAFEKLVDSEIVATFLDGISAGVVGLIGCTAISIAKQGIKASLGNTSVQKLLIFGASLVVLYRYKTFRFLNPLIVISAILSGQILFRTVNV